MKKDEPGGTPVNADAADVAPDDSERDVSADAVTEVTAAGEAGEATAVTQVAAAGDAPPASPGEEPHEAAGNQRHSGRLRTTLIGVLIVISCLGIMVTGVAWWAHYTVLNTDGYMKLVGPIGKDPVAIQSLSDYIAGQVVSATDLQSRTQEALPPRAQFLASPITDAVNTFIAKQVNKLLSTPKAYELWLKANEIAHEKIVGLLRGDNTYTYIAGDDVKLDVLPLISQALVWIDGKLPGALSSRFSPPVIPPGTPPDLAIQEVSLWSGKTLPADFGQVTLLTSASLGPAQTAIRIFDRLVIVLPIVTALLIAVTIWLSRKRRHTIIALGIGAAVALILTRVIAKQGSDVIVSDIKAGGGLSMVKDVVNASLGPLTNLTIWVVVIGVIVAFVAWIIGRKDVQAAVVEAGRGVARKTDEAAQAESPTLLWIAAHAAILRLAGLVVGLLLLLLVASSWWLIALFLVLVVLYEGVLSLIARQWPFAREMRGDAAG
jgi:hypothetical protein